MNKTKNYGTISSIALDPIEKKPLYHFYPGSNILSVGSFGCNMKCPFCQNHEISHPDSKDIPYRKMSPNELALLSIDYVSKNNIGVAFTYNEPLMTYDFVRDTSILLKNQGQKSVVVTNGCFGDKVLDEILPVVDAFNIDLKGFREDIYSKLGGRLSTVLNFIEKASAASHVELTSLIVPGINDSLSDMEAQAKWISSLNQNIPLHITRFFPRYKYTHHDATDINLLIRMSDVARKYLRYVYIGNV